MTPELKLVREIPKSLNKKAIERAVESFLLEVDLDVDPAGFFNQTIQKVATATILKIPGRDFWMAEAYGEVAAYTLADIVSDLDGRLCYWVTQSWVAPEWRGDAEVKKWWAQIRQYAKENFCSHLVAVSCRNADAHCRFLGNGMRPYASLLKETLED